jgi:hypothetical protein
MPAVFNHPGLGAEEVSADVRVIKGVATSITCSSAGLHAVPRVVTYLMVPSGPIFSWLCGSVA